MVKILNQLSYRQNNICLQKRRQDMTREKFRKKKQKQKQKQTRDDRRDLFLDPHTFGTFHRPPLSTPTPVPWADPATNLTSHLFPINIHPSPQNNKETRSKHERNGNGRKNTIRNKAKHQDKLQTKSPLPSANTIPTHTVRIRLCLCISISFSSFCHATMLTFSLSVDTGLMPSASHRATRSLAWAIFLQVTSYFLHI